MRATYTSKILPWFKPLPTESFFRIFKLIITLIHFIVKFTLFKGPIAVVYSYFCIFLAISLGWKLQKNSRKNCWVPSQPNICYTKKWKCFVPTTNHNQVSTRFFRVFDWKITAFFRLVCELSNFISKFEPLKWKRNRLKKFFYLIKICRHFFAPNIKINQG